MVSSYFHFSFMILVFNQLQKKISEFLTSSSAKFKLFFFFSCQQVFGFGKFFLILINELKVLFAGNFTMAKFGILFFNFFNLSLELGFLSFQLLQQFWNSLKVIWKNQKFQCLWFFSSAKFGMVASFA